MISHALIRVSAPAAGPVVMTTPSDGSSYTSWFILLDEVGVEYGPVPAVGTGATGATIEVYVDDISVGTGVVGGDGNWTIDGRMYDAGALAGWYYSHTAYATQTIGGVTTSTAVVTFWIGT